MSRHDELIYRKEKAISINENGDMFKEVIKQDVIKHLLIKWGHTPNKKGLARQKAIMVANRYLNWVF